MIQNILNGGLITVRTNTHFITNTGNKLIIKKLGAISFKEIYPTTEIAKITETEFELIQLIAQTQKTYNVKHINKMLTKIKTILLELVIKNETYYNSTKKSYVKCEDGVLTMVINKNILEEIKITIDKDTFFKPFMNSNEEQCFSDFLYIRWNEEKPQIEMHENCSYNDIEKYITIIFNEVEALIKSNNLFNQHPNLIVCTNRENEHYYHKQLINFIGENPDVITIRPRHIGPLRRNDIVISERSVRGLSMNKQIVVAGITHEQLLELSKYYPNLCGYVV